MLDPLARLLAELQHDGRPSLAWLVEWAPDGSARRAWEASRDSRAMLAALELAGRAEDAARADAALDASVAHAPREHRPWEVVRGAVPDPPPLDALLAAAAARRR